MMTITPAIQKWVTCAACILLRPQRRLNRAMIPPTQTIAAISAEHCRKIDQNIA